jgi:hypothetical protein
MRLALVLAAVVSGAIPALAQPQAVELPMRRPGYWEIRMMTGGGPGGQEFTVQTCTDAATERQMVQYGFGQLGQTCQRYDIRRDGEDYVIETDCLAGQTRTTARSIISGDLRATYSLRVEGTVQTIGQSEFQQTLTTHEGRFVSARCGGGLRPGDILLPGGQRLNIRDLAGTGDQAQTPPRRR